MARKETNTREHEHELLECVCVYVATTTTPSTTVPHFAFNYILPVGRPQKPLPPSTPLLPPPPARTRAHSSAKTKRTPVGSYRPNRLLHNTSRVDRVADDPPANERKYTRPFLVANPLA